MLPESHEHKVVPFVSPGFTVKLADRPWERRQAMALRRRVFCGEQGLFADDDRDALDEFALPIVALSWWSGMAEQVVGTVRIHDHGDGLWGGSRLAVADHYRRLARLGTELIRIAVGSARARGCSRFLAQVQQANVPLFERLHWQSLHRINVCGRPHVLMQADLAHYPPCVEPARGVVTTRRQAA